jgi:hypothetical protein
VGTACVVSSLNLDACASGLNGETPPPIRDYVMLGSAISPFRFLGPEGTSLATWTAAVTTTGALLVTLLSKEKRRQARDWLHRRTRYFRPWETTGVEITGAEIDAREGGAAVLYLRLFNSGRRSVTAEYLVQSWAVNNRTLTHREARSLPLTVRGRSSDISVIRFQVTDDERRNLRDTVPEALNHRDIAISVSIQLHGVLIVNGTTHPTSHRSCAFEYARFYAPPAGMGTLSGYR